ncbi:MAG: hypothetical protein ACJ798_18025 [Phenylobacterium sp.]
MALKAILAAVAAAAIAVGFALPGLHAGKAEPRSQISTIDLER